MKRFEIAGFSAVLFVLLHAAPVRPQATPSLQGADVQGVVTDLQSGQPLQNARISLLGSRGQLRATTDSAGKFAFSAVAPGEYRVDVVRDGYLWSSRQSGPAMLTINAGQDLKNVAFKLLKTSAISGRILDENGDPASSLMVMAMQPEYRNGRRGLAGIPPRGDVRSASSTNGAGEYRLYGLESGEYYLRATETGLGTSQPSTYYPGTMDLNGAVTVTVQPGQDLSAIDFKLAKSPLYAVRLRIDLPAQSAGPQSPLPSIWFIQRRDPSIWVDFTPVNTVVSTGSNRYQSARLPSGAYELSWVQPAPRLFGHLIFDIKDHDEDLGVLVPTPGITIPGQIHMPDLQRTEFKAAQVSMVSADGGSALTSFAPIGQDGKFAIQNVAPGDYWISIAGIAPEAYVESARYGVRRSEKADISVGREPDGQMEVVLAALGGAVTGVVRDARAEAVAMGRVVVFPARPNRKTNPSLIKATQADSRGSFTVRGIPPGEYRAIAWEDTLPGLYRDPDFLANWEQRAVRLSISGNSTTTADVRVVAPAR